MGFSAVRMHVLASGLAIMAGLAAGAIMDMGRRSSVGGAIAALVVAVMAAMPLWSLTTSVQALDRADTPAGRQFMGAFDIVQKDRSWSLEDTVARMSILRSHDAGVDRWIFEAIYAIGYELYRNRQNQPFAKPLLQ
jgi:hypothetical protein